MKTSKEYQAELEALRAQMLRLKHEEEQELLNKPQKELTPEELKKNKRKRIESNIVFALFGVMIVLALVGKFLEKSFLIVASLAVMGLIIVIMAFTGDTQRKSPFKIRYVKIKSREFITRAGFCCIGLSILALVVLIAAGFESYIKYIFCAMFIIFFVLVIGNGVTPYFYVKKKVNHLKKVCTEPVTAICTDPNIKDTYDIIQEKIELMPLYVNVKNTSRASMKTKHIKSFCSPIYEIYYDGEIYTLCDNNYNNFNVPDEGYERELLINPDNPLEFYDFIRYKKELSAAFGHAASSILAMMPFVMFFVLFIMMYNL